MIVDTSAVLAILFEESDAEVYARALTEADACRMSAATFVEAAVVVDTQTNDEGSRAFDTFVRRAAIAIEPVTEEQAHIARQAYAAFAYALAKLTGEPLLFKGKDFKKTDIPSALGSS